MPRPDFPKTIFEFNKWFPDEDSCMKFLIQSRWQDGFVCPKCKHNEYYWLEPRKLLQCKKCGYQVSPTAGTIMHRSRMPLTTWFQAAYQVTTNTPGKSALQFQRQVGLLRYETAFTMLHKLRAGMVKSGRDKLSGLVEVDETYIGGERHGKTGRGAEGKVIVIGAVEVRGKYANRVRLKVIPNVTQATLTEFIKSNIAEGSTIKTDDWIGYNKVEAEGYSHVVSEEIIHIHRVISNLKTWLLGTHHGSVSKQHLQAYLNEFTFRFNRRKTPMAAFQTVLGLAKERLSPTYKGLYGVAKGKELWTHPSNPL
jgi:transposase-like protein/Zn ribbon nucleic-acid-binding protein